MASRNDKNPTAADVLEMAGQLGDVITHETEGM